MLIPREIIIVFSEHLKLGINMRRTIVIEYYNNGIIRRLSRDFSLQVERVFHVKLLSCACYLFFASHRF